MEMLCDTKGLYGWKGASFALRGTQVLFSDTGLHCSIFLLLPKNFNDSHKGD